MGNHLQFAFIASPSVAIGGSVQGAPEDRVQQNRPAH
jgi:hypothetical protein